MLIAEFTNICNYESKLNRTNENKSEIRDVGFEFVSVSFLFLIYSQNKCQEILDYFFIAKNVLKRAICFQ